MTLVKMAWRNLWRNRRRTVATTGAMSLALLVTILYSSMVNGYLINMESDALDFEIGAVQVFARGYRQKPSLYTNMKDADNVVKKLVKAGLPASARLLGSGLVAAGDSSAGVQLRGIDVNRESRVLMLGRQVAAGKWLDANDPKGVVLGRRLARTLGVKPGAELVVLSQATDGSIANELYRVRGILRGLGVATDRAGFFMTAPAFRELMAFRTGAHQIIVKRQADMLVDDIAEKVKGAAKGHDVQTWRQLMPTLATLLETARGMIKFMFLILNVVVAIVVLNAMLMSVFERIKEFGVFKAIGAGPGSVLKLIFYESMMQMGLAILIGVALSVPVLWYLATVGIDMGSMAGVSAMGIAIMSHWKAVVTTQSYTMPIFMLVFVVSIAVLYPSLKAAFIEPVEAMRHH